MNLVSRVLLAEFLGTFALIFMGAGAAAALGPGNVPAVALAHGLTIMAFVAAFGDLSGGHINPAVTIGLAVAREFPARRVIPYVAAQLVGGIAAGFGLLAIFGSPVNDLGATVIDMQRITEVGGFMLEAFGTFLLVTVVLNSAVRGGAGRLAPLAIGMTVTVCILAFGVLTGGSVNPARTIGPAVAAGVYDGIAVYLVAQLVGGTLAGMLYRVLWTRRADSAQLSTGAVPAE
jgi:MIP family channel proteins